MSSWSLTSSAAVSHSTNSPHSPPPFVVRPTNARRRVSAAWAESASPPTREQTCAPSPSLRSERRLARGLQRCVLQHAAEVETLRAGITQREERIAELERRLTAKERSNGRGEEVDWEGVSIGDVRAALHAAVNALQRVETECATERQKRRELERENESLRRRLSPSGDADPLTNGAGSVGFGRYGVQTAAMAFVEGPLRRFMAESAELQSRMSSGMLYK